MEMISVTYSEKDPISKAPIKIPVKNSVFFKLQNLNQIIFKKYIKKK